MSSPATATYPAAGFHESAASLSRADTHEDVTPSEIAVGVIIGRSSEYFDFFVFGIACVLVFPSFLFPFLSRLDGTLMAFALLAVAFVVRPVGTAISMAIQRRWGRGTKLTIALFMLGVCTVGMAFLPGYKDAGTAAIVALLILRVGQGLALGGSWDGLPSLLAMSAAGPMTSPFLSARSTTSMPGHWPIWKATPRPMAPQPTTATRIRLPSASRVFRSWLIITDEGGRKNAVRSAQGQPETLDLPVRPNHDLCAIIWAGRGAGQVVARLPGADGGRLRKTGKVPLSVPRRGY